MVWGEWLHALHSHPALNTSHTMLNLPARHSRDQWAPCRPSDSLPAAWVAACSPSSWLAWRTAQSSCTAKHRVMSPKNWSLAQNSMYIRLCWTPSKWNAVCLIASVNLIHFSHKTSPKKMCFSKFDVHSTVKVTSKWNTNLSYHKCIADLLLMPHLQRTCQLLKTTVAFHFYFRLKYREQTTRSK